MSVFVLLFLHIPANASLDAMQQLVLNQKTFNEYDQNIKSPSSNEFDDRYQYLRVALDTIDTIVRFQGFSGRPDTKYGSCDATDEQIADGVFEFIVNTYVKALSILFDQKSLYDIHRDANYFDSIMSHLQGYVDLAGKAEKEHLSYLNNLTKMTLDNFKEQDAGNAFGRIVKEYFGNYDISAEQNADLCYWLDNRALGDSYFNKTLASISKLDIDNNELRKYYYVKNAKNNFSRVNNNLVLDYNGSKTGDPSSVAFYVPGYSTNHAEIDKSLEPATKYFGDNKIAKSLHINYYDYDPSKAAELAKTLSKNSGKMPFQEVYVDFSLMKSLGMLTESKQNYFRQLINYTEVMPNKSVNRPTKFVFRTKNTGATDYYGQDMIKILAKSNASLNHVILYSSRSHFKQIDFSTENLAEYLEINMHKVIGYHLNLDEKLFPQIPTGLKKLKLKAEDNKNNRFYKCVYDILSYIESENRADFTLVLSEKNFNDHILGGKHFLLEDPDDPNSVIDISFESVSNIAIKLRAKSAKTFTVKRVTSKGEIHIKLQN